MNKGYQRNDKIVKLRRIKANQKRKPDKGLEDLWKALADVIEKRKTQNAAKAAQSEAEKEKGSSKGKSGWAKLKNKK